MTRSGSAALIMSVLTLVPLATYADQHTDVADGPVEVQQEVRYPPPVWDIFDANGKHLHTESSDAGETGSGDGTTSSTSSSLRRRLHTGSSQDYNSFVGAPFYNFTQGPKRVLVARFNYTGSTV